MAEMFKLEIVTPDRNFPVLDVSLINVPAEEGRLTVLANHENMVCRLKAGMVVSRDINNAQIKWEIGPGTLNVDHNNTTLLVRDIKIEE